MIHLGTFPSKRFLKKYMRAQGVEMDTTEDFYNLCFEQNTFKTLFEALK